MFDDKIITDEIQLQLMCLLFLYVKNILSQYKIDDMIKMSLKFLSLEKIN